MNFCPLPETTYTGRWATVTGWGSTAYQGQPSAVLREVHVPVISSAACGRTTYGSIITRNMICAGVPAGGRDSCQVSSGAGTVYCVGFGAKSVMSVRLQKFLLCGWAKC